MAKELEGGQVEDALRAVGELIAGDRERLAIVVVGGAAMNLLGIVRRSTSDVDVIARAYKDDRASSSWSERSHFRRCSTERSTPWRATSDWTQAE